MNANGSVENARAAREALEAVANRATSGSESAVEEALTRYLAAEEFHERHSEDAASRDEPAGDEPGSSD